MRQKKTVFVIAIVILNFGFIFMMATRRRENPIPNPPDAADSGALNAALARPHFVKVSDRIKVIEGLSYDNLVKGMTDGWTRRNLGVAGVELNSLWEHDLDYVLADRLVRRLSDELAKRDLVTSQDDCATIFEEKFSEFKSFIERDISRAIKGQPAVVDSGDAGDVNERLFAVMHATYSAVFLTATFCDAAAVRRQLRSISAFRKQIWDRLERSENVWPAKTEAVIRCIGPRDLFSASVLKYCVEHSQAKDAAQGARVRDVIAEASARKLFKARSVEIVKWNARVDWYDLWNRDADDANVTLDRTNGSITVTVLGYGDRDYEKTSEVINKLLRESQDDKESYSEHEYYLRERSSSSNVSSPLVPVPEYLTTSFFSDVKGRVQSIEKMTFRKLVRRLSDNYVIKSSGAANLRDKNESDFEYVLADRVPRRLLVDLMQLDDQTAGAKCQEIFDEWFAEYSGMFESLVSSLEKGKLERQYNIPGRKLAICSSVFVSSTFCNTNQICNQLARIRQLRRDAIDRLSKLSDANQAMADIIPVQIGPSDLFVVNVLMHSIEHSRSSDNRDQDRIRQIVDGALEKQLLQFEVVEIVPWNAIPDWFDLKTTKDPAASLDRSKGSLSTKMFSYRNRDDEQSRLLADQLIDVAR